MNFETQLFISYAHLDNQPLLPDQLGWISRFHSSLQAILSMRMGRKVEIWRDSKLAGTDVFSREIVEQFLDTAVLLSVLTPRYVESEWCTREVREFCKAADQTGGVIVDNKSRVVKVIKAPVDSEASLPLVMQEVLGYPFYTYDSDETPLELDPAYGDELAKKFSLKLAKLAWEVAQLLKELEARPPSREEGLEAASSKPTIYLAECSYDCRETREILEGELRLHGYTVLPNHELPRQEDAYVVEVERLLDSCELSVHLIGTSYGLVPDGASQDSVVVLQNRLATRQSKDRGLLRLIWLPDEVRSGQKRQQELIEVLRCDAEAQFGADMITGDLESLKHAVHSTLARPGPQKPPVLEPEAGNGEPPLIYLISDAQDRRATIPLRKALRDLGFEVEIPLFEGSASAVRQANRDLLSRCAVVLMFYGAGSEEWRRTVEGDLRKMRSYRNGKPLPPVFTYLAQPATADKEELIELEEPRLINGLEDVSEAELRVMLRAGGVGG